MRYILLIFLLAASLQTLAQGQKPAAKPAQKPAASTPTPSQPPQPQMSALTQHFLRKYALASQWNDFAVAKDALYDLIIENPSNDSLLFTLAYFYYENRQHAPALLVSLDLLARSPKNLNYLEIAAVSGEALGVLDKALQNYETIYLLTSNVNSLYKIAFLQYDLKRFGESLTNADILLSKAEVDTEKVYFTDQENKSKEYPMKVAVLNLKGMIQLEQNDKAAAKKSFEDALALAPDFVLAKQNLAKAK